MNTFAGHEWIAVDYDTSESLYVDRRYRFKAVKNSGRSRTRVYVTKPRKWLPSRVKSRVYVTRVVTLHLEHSKVAFPLFEKVTLRRLFLVRFLHKKRQTPAHPTTPYPLSLSRAPFPCLSSGRSFVIAVSVAAGVTLPVTSYPEPLQTPPRYVEVMATADTSVVKFHGKDRVEKYVLTLMNIVSPGPT